LEAVKQEKVKVAANQPKLPAPAPLGSGRRLGFHASSPPRTSSSSTSEASLPGRRCARSGAFTSCGWVGSIDFVVPESGTRELELRDYIGVLRRRKGIIALAVAVVVGAALIVSYLKTPIYEATSEVLVRPRTSQQILTPNANQNQGGDAQRAIDTEIKVLQSRTVEQAVRKELGRVPSVSASGAGQTDVISVSVRSTNAQQAARDANTYARTYLEVRRNQAVDDFLSAGQEVQAKIVDLQHQIDALPAASPRPDPNVDAQRQSFEQQQAYYRQQLDQLQVAAQISQSGGGQVVSRATTPSSPVEPNTIRNGLIALALGLLLGVGLAFLREYLDDSIRTKEDLERASDGLPVVGLIPAVAVWKNQNAPYLVTVERPSSPAAEAYRTLRTSVQFLGLDRPVQSLVVTSPTKEEGKTTTLANLAVTFAQAGQRVILLDCDLRRPRIHQFFGLPNDVGFTSVLLGTAPLTEALQPIGQHGSLAVLASGRPPPDPSELLSSHRTREVVEALESRADLVFIDSPPVLPVTDPLVLSGFVDATLLVVSSDQTTKRSLHRAIELLTQINAPLMGTILNEVGPERGYAYGYSGYGYYRRGADATELNGGRRRAARARAQDSS
jgi:succinoglycan biosynthesis transport protein ExoP